MDYDPISRTDPRRQLLAWLVALPTLLLLLMALLLKLFVYPEFKVLEHRAVERDLLRVTRELTKEKASLLSAAKDFAPWDATYQFMSGADSEFTQQNLGPEDMLNLNLDFALFLDSAGTEFWSSSETPSPVSSDQLRARTQALPPDQWSNGRVTWFATDQGEAWLFAWHPITDSYARQTPAGTLFFGRRLGQERINEMRQRLMIDFDLAPGRSLPASGPAEIAATVDQSLRPRSREVFIDMSVGDDRFVITVPAHRNITAGGRAAINQVLRLTTLFMLLLCSVIWAASRRSSRPAVEPASPDVAANGDML